MLKLNIGCGLKYKKSYINIDAYDDTVADEIMLADNLAYEDESIDLIESFQLMEHLGLMKTFLSLGEWFRVLKTNSSLIIETPDIDKTFEIYLKTSDPIQKALILNWIFGSSEKGFEHKFCFPAGLLRKMFIEIGFVDIMEKYHEKTFGIPTYTFIAKKPLEVNPNYLLVHKLRKRCFNELEHFNKYKNENFQIDFEKCVLGYTIDFTPRDFSQTTFNEIFANTVTYNLNATSILLEESSKLNIISKEQADKLLEKVKILENYSFIDFLYYTWEDDLLKNKNLNKAFLSTLEIAKNIGKHALFDINSEDFEDHINQIIINKEFEPTINERFFSNYYIEYKLSKYFAKFIKGSASENERKICNTLAIVHT